MRAFYACLTLGTFLARAADNPPANHANSIAAAGNRKAECPGTPRNDVPFAMKGAWIPQTTSSGMLGTAKGISMVLGRSRALGLNAVFPVAWNRGEVFHKKGTSRQQFGLRTRELYTADEKGNMAPREDILEEVIRQAHAGDKPLKVIPWFEHGLYVPPDSELAKQHPDWFLRKRVEGRVDLSVVNMKAIDQDAINGQIGAPSLILNPAIPEARAFVVGLVKDVVENYDVDGIQFDDHLQWPLDQGYDPLTQAAYNLDQYRRKHAGQDPPEAERKQVVETPLPLPNHPEWMRWRSEQVTTLMREISQAVRKAKPRIEVQLSPTPYPWSYNKYLQNWPEWVDPKNGYVDRILVQNYVDRNFDAEITRIENMNLCVPVDIGILAESRDQTDPKGIMSQVKRTQSSRARLGVSYFPLDLVPDALLEDKKP